jgi:hypothetical protein
VGGRKSKKEKVTEEGVPGGNLVDKRRLQARVLHVTAPTRGWCSRKPSVFNIRRMKTAEGDHPDREEYSTRSSDE